MHMMRSHSDKSRTHADRLIQLLELNQDRAIPLSERKTAIAPSDSAAKQILQRDVYLFARRGIRLTHMLERTMRCERAKMEGLIGVGVAISILAISAGAWIRISADSSGNCVFQVAIIALGVALLIVNVIRRFRITSSMASIREALDGIRRHYERILGMASQPFARLRLAAYLLPKAIRVRVFEPVFNDLLVDYLETRQYHGRMARGFLKVCFGFRVVLIVVECMWALLLSQVKWLIPIGAVIRHLWTAGRGS